VVNRRWISLQDSGTRSAGPGRWACSLARTKRNTVERAINRLKGFRAVATRYEKRAYIYLGTVTLAALMIWLRT
jgi:transposase